MLIEAIETNLLPEHLFAIPVVGLQEKEKASEKTIADVVMTEDETDAHYRDKYYKAIIIQNRKRGIPSVLAENGSCSTLGLIENSAVYEMEYGLGNNLEIECEPVRIQTGIIKPEMTEVFNALILPNQTVRSRKQTRRWIGF